MKEQNQKTKMLALMGILTAIIIVMAFTPVGYLRIGLVSISFLMIPVALGAIAQGPAAGAVLGTVFGITSFIQCFGMDFFGTFLAQRNVVFTFIMCVIGRALAGFLAGLIYKLMSKTKIKGPICFSGAGLCAAIFNTLFFVGFMILLFGKGTVSEATGGALDAGLNVINFFAMLVGVNAIWEAIASCVLTGAIGTALSKAKLISKG